ncbi:hypothetical protein OM076_43810 [Solirubrobacter ginsenosidimutans]|uniref:MAM domain-containing protein n=1 Tax=Solirubrobacter ginsenosidimutans TaxID=490573 RepID=A0A9X3S6W6_9ACTN|nr:hypothetical protein [Solirubrobacter ginsenosidimutans]MDA0167267.1 hypothetical protein [Solirubrobacter ginsenosidimutans]
MPIIISGRRKRSRLLAATLGAAALIVTPAHAAAIANPYNCAPQPTLTQSFSTWNDANLYTPVPNAGLENAATGWILTGSARVIAGNEPWKVGGAADNSALALPANSSAITAPLCIDETYPHFRLFARNTGSLKGVLKIEVLYFDAKGNITNTKPVDYTTATNAWQPTGMVGIDVFTSKTTVAAAPVAFRFTTGKDASYQIDDVYVDPWARAR